MEQTWGPVALGCRPNDGQEVLGWSGSAARLRELGKLHGGNDDMWYGINAMDRGYGLGQTS